VDDDLEDMELEDVWELQRSRSRSRIQTKNPPTKITTKTKSKSRPNNKQNKSYTLKRVKSTGKKNKNVKNGRAASALRARSSDSRPNRFDRRAASTGRPKTRSGWLFPSGNGKQVSISNYVETIHLPPENIIEGRGRRSSRSQSTPRARQRNFIEPEKKKKSFSWKKKKKKQGQDDYYSSSDESYDNDYQDRANSFSTRPGRIPPVRHSRPKAIPPRGRNYVEPEKKKKPFSWKKKKKEQRRDDYYSSSDSESSDNDYKARPNFFTMM